MSAVCPRPGCGAPKAGYQITCDGCWSSERGLSSGLGSEFAKTPKGTYLPKPAVPEKPAECARVACRNPPTGHFSLCRGCMDEWMARPEPKATKEDFDASPVGYYLTKPVETPPVDRCERVGCEGEISSRAWRLCDPCADHWSRLPEMDLDKWKAKGITGKPKPDPAPVDDPECRIGTEVPTAVMESMVGVPLPGVAAKVENGSARGVNWDDEPLVSIRVTADPEGAFRAQNQLGDRTVRDVLGMIGVLHVRRSVYLAAMRAYAAEQQQPMPKFSRELIARIAGVPVESLTQWSTDTTNPERIEVRFETTAGEHAEIWRRVSPFCLTGSRVSSTPGRTTQGDLFFTRENYITATQQPMPARVRMALDGRPFREVSPYFQYIPRDTLLRATDDKPTEEKTAMSATKKTTADLLRALLDNVGISVSIVQIESIAPDMPRLIDTNGNDWAIRKEDHAEALRLFALYKKETTMDKTDTDKTITARALDYGAVIAYRLGAEELVEFFTPVIADAMAGDGKGAAHNRKRAAIAEGLRSPIGKAFVSGVMGYCAPLFAPAISALLGDQTARIDALADELKIQAGTRTGRAAINKLKAALAPKMGEAARILSSLPDPKTLPASTDRCAVIDIEDAKVKARP